MTDTTVYRLRILVDVPYKSEDGKPLSGPHLTMMAQRTATYARVCASEGLEDKIEVIFDESLNHQTAHHHDATEDRCRADYLASGDGLGPQ